MINRGMPYTINGGVIVEKKSEAMKKNVPYM